MSGIHTACVKNSSKRREQAGEPEDNELDPPNPNADERRSVPVAANGIQVPPEAGLAQDIGEDGAGRQEYHDGDRHAEDASLPKYPEGLPEGTNRIAFRDDKGHAGEDLPSGKRHDERVEPQDCYEEAVEEAEPETEQSRERHDSVGIDAGFGQHQGPDNGRQTCRRSQRKVDAADKQNQRLTESNEPDEGRLTGHDAKIVRGTENWEPPRRVRVRVRLGQ